MDNGEYIVVKETSDPMNVLLYEGTLVAENRSEKQHWQVLDTKTDGQILIIDNQFQSSLQDEKVYHEWFVHSAMIGLLRRNRVLILGGGEGCVLREVLRWKDVEKVVQVDWDESLVSWFKFYGHHWNEGVYGDPRAEIVCTDAFKWLKDSYELFDAIFVDLLDPSIESLPWFSELLSMCKVHLAPGGAISINAGNVIVGKQTVACTLANTMKTIFPDSGYDHVSVRKHVPSFLGEWCFLMATSKMWSSKIHDSEFPTSVKSITKESFHDALLWPSSYPVEVAQFWRKKLETGFSPKQIQIEEHYGC